MAHIEPFGGSVYDNQRFKDNMNRNYFPLDNMKRTVALLKGREDIDIETMEFGQYQPILAPKDVNSKGSRFWLREMGIARIQFSAQPNTTPLSKDEPDVIPLTKCALLDACVRKCFNSDPPICMVIDVRQKPKDAANAGQHEILLAWEYGTGNVPTLLRLTMVCPFIPLIS